MIETTARTVVPAPTGIVRVIAGVGDRGAWLLAGPRAEEGPELLAAHLARVGAIQPFDRDRDHRSALRNSGLRGRGGGGFPLAAKIDTAMLAPGTPLVIINGSESEPASRKDATILALRPHLVLDGAAVVAALAGSDEVVVHLHRGANRAATSMERAIAERRAAGLPDPRWRLSSGPSGYVTGEASAIASLLNGGEARPAFSAAPMARRGPSGRPTLVNNAETVAHVAMVARLGPVAWRAAGAPSSPGPQLVTLVGGVAQPGSVLEVVGTATMGMVLRAAGLEQPPPTILVGGYAGTWIRGHEAWNCWMDHDHLGRLGASPGCGLIAVLPHRYCGLAETARLVTYLAGETAGQCGPCVRGLPQLAEACRSLANGTMRRRGLRRLLSLVEVVDGGGACSHPDGVVRLVRSALAAFADDVTLHLSGHTCAWSGSGPVFPVPAIGALGREWS